MTSSMSPAPTSNDFEFLLENLGDLVGLILNFFLGGIMSEHRPETGQLIDPADVDSVDRLPAPPVSRQEPTDLLTSAPDR